MDIWLVAGLAIELITWTKTVEIQTRFAEFQYAIGNIFIAKLSLNFNQTWMSWY